MTARKPKQYIKENGSTHIRSVDLVHNLHKRSSDYLWGAGETSHLVLKVDNLDVPVLINGSPAIQKGDEMHLFGLTLVEHPGHEKLPRWYAASGYIVYDNDRTGEKYRYGYIPKGADKEN